MILTPEERKQNERRRIDEENENKFVFYCLKCGHVIHTYKSSTYVKCGSYKCFETYNPKKIIEDYE